MKTAPYGMNGNARCPNGHDYPNPGAQRATAAEPERSDQRVCDWLLPADAINEAQNRSIDELVTKGKGAHFMTLLMRKDGKDLKFEADWLKHLVPVSVAEPLPPQPATKAQLQARVQAAWPFSRRDSQKRPEPTRDPTTPKSTQTDGMTPSDQRRDSESQIWAGFTTIQHHRDSLAKAIEKLREDFIVQFKMHTDVEPGFTLVRGKPALVVGRNRIIDLQALDRVYPQSYRKIFGANITNAQFKEFLEVITADMDFSGGQTLLMEDI